VPGAHRVLRGLTEGNILTMTREGKGKSPTIYRFSRLIAITGTSSGLIFPVNPAPIRKIPEIVAYQKYTRIIPEESLRLTGDTEEAVEYHFFDFVIHRNDIG